MERIIIIRKAKKSELAEIIKIARFLPQWFTEKGIKNMSLDLKYQHLLVAAKNDTIVGFLSFYVSEGQSHIGWIGVSPKLHRQGIGSKLIDKLVDILRRDGISKLLVETLGDSVDYKPYVGTRAFYYALGFKEFERIKMDNPECPELLRMIKKLQ